MRKGCSDKDKTPEARNRSKWTESQGSAKAVLARKEKSLVTQMVGVVRDFFLILVARPLRSWKWGRV